MSDDLTPEAVEQLAADLQSVAAATGPNDAAAIAWSAAATLRALYERLPEVEAERDSAVRGRNDWRDDYKALSSAIVGDTGLSAMTVATQARLYRPRAEAAEAALATAILDVWACCEELEDEAYAKLPTVATDHEKGFWAAQKMTAKRIRRATTMPATLIPNEQPNE